MTKADIVTNIFGNKLSRSLMSHQYRIEGGVQSACHPGDPTLKAGFDA